MAGLVLGPLLRHVDDSSATVWVETDAPASVEVLGARAPTFAVEGHHYALVVVEGLPPACELPYAVHLDGELVWPEPGSPFPPSVVRTRDPARRFRLVFGSCRVTAEPQPSARDQLGVDALQAYAQRMLGQPGDAWPDALLMVGDQVYADDPSPRTKSFLRARRDTHGEPGEEVADFEEYTRLYQESWRDPEVRWLLSTVPSAMIFDDHDIHDDWNTSKAWRDDHEGQHWWHDRIVGGLMSYWVYQHLGNLSPAALAQDALWKDVQDVGVGGDAGRLLRDYAVAADEEADTGHGPRWSYVRDFGRTRMLVIDSRCGRRLTPGDRSMVDEEEWAWLVEQAHADVDHLLLATSLPWLLPPMVHWAEHWNEAVCDGAWGRAAAWLGEKLRQGADLEHWSAFRRSFDALAELVADVGSGGAGVGVGADRADRVPATVVALSGDVHHAYLAEASYPAERGVRSRVFQATCSPLHNPVDRLLEIANRAAATARGARLGAWLARRAGIGPSPLSWRLTSGPHFGNEIAVLETEGRWAHLAVERAGDGPDGRPALSPVFDAELSPAQS